jgi:cell division protein FtsX
MKDRIKRTAIKKPSHRLKRACIATVSFTLVFSSLALAILLNVSHENKMLNERIDNYTVQIDLLENKNDTDARKMHDKTSD